MIILGLNHGEFNSSAAIYKDGKILAGSPEERFNRKKITKDFPKESVRFCLDFLGIKLKDCDYIAQGWNPGAAWEKYNPLLSGTRIKREDYYYTIPDNLYNFTDRKPSDWVMMAVEDQQNMPPVYYIHHHRAHAANSFFLSPYEQAAILTCDGRGEIECTTMSFGSGNEIRTLCSQNIPHSLGMFYATYTELLGYKPDSDEWKVMALSAFDIKCDQYYKKIRSTVKLLGNGFFELDQSFYKGFMVEQPFYYTEKLVKLLGNKKGVPGEEVGEWHLAVSVAMQQVSEDIAFNMLSALHKKTKSENVVLGGGFFMNSVFNGKVTQKTPFKNIYVAYAPADLGNSIGAALYVAHCIKKQKRDYSFNSSCIGPGFSDSQIEAALLRRKVNYEIIPHRENEIAKLLADGAIVAVLNGRMEFGERALGNRSILADPRRPDIKDKINAIIKYRESYRPFAPAVQKEKASIYFDVEDDYECPYMEKVVPVKSQYRDILPAITHVDGSARIQTVDKRENKGFYKILEEFEKITSIPIVLNTSFNVNKEPIALSPDDALTTFFNSGLEYLFLGSYLITKNKITIYNSAMGGEY